MGLQGDIGFTGSQGDVGFTGSTGEFGGVGFTGSQGDVGFTGSIGFTGSQGDTGFTGSQGDVGFTGSKGDVGFTGSTGEFGGVGFTGSQGDVGFTGSKGDIGFTGSSGEFGGTGFTGSQGDTGFTGSKGDIGFTGSLGFTGSKGEGADITIVDDSSTNASLYVTFVDSTSGTVDGVSVSSTKLFFNPSTGTLNASEFNSLSDITLKENASEILDVRDILNSIETISFNWKDTGTKSYGVIAQQLEEVLPELVTNTSGKKYVNYIPLIAILIDGYKSLSERLEYFEKNK
jgi:hypothetical protein